MKKPKSREKRLSQINRGKKRTARAKKTSETKFQRREQIEHDIKMYQRKIDIATDNLMSSRESYHK